VVSRTNLRRGHTRSCGCVTIKGPEHHNWKGGISRPYDTTEYRLWRTAVYERDKYTCDSCQKRHCNLNAHHLYSYSTHPELVYEVNNGVTLCEKHHYDFHNWLGTTRTACVPDDYYRFKKLIDDDPKRCALGH
jgi:5-methylcytosine-specific restriction endonuclease McrA